MRISKQAQRNGNRLFRSCFVKGSLDAARAKKLVKMLISVKPRGYLGVLSHVHRLIKLDVARRATLVESAITLTDDMKKNIRKELRSVHGKDLTVAFKANRALIGGVRIRVGSEVYDSSIQTRLRDLADQF